MSIESSCSAPGKQETAAKAKSYDELVQMLWQSRPNSFFFQVEGVDFCVRLLPDRKDINIISAEIGYIPFTQESALKRRLLTSVTESISIKASGIKFNIGEDGKITLHGEIPFEQDTTPELNFSHIISFLLLVLPHIRLIGSIL